MHLAAVVPDSSPRTTLAPRLLRLPDVEARTGLKKSTIYAAIRAGTFPQPVMVGARSVAWRAAEVDAWCERRQAEFERRAEQFKDFGDQLSRSTVDINASLIDDDRERGLVQIELDRQVLQRRLDELQLYGEQRERLQAQLDENIAARQRALEESLKPAWQRMVEGWSDTTRHMADSYEVLMDGVVARTEDALTRMIRDGKLSIGDLADFVQDAIARMVAQKAVAKLLEIGDVLFGGGLGGGFAKGAAFQGGSVVPFAVGGVVSSPTYFPMSRGRTGLMGEAGPEAITLGATQAKLACLCSLAAMHRLEGVAPSLSASPSALARAVLVMLGAECVDRRALACQVAAAGRDLAPLVPQASLDALLDKLLRSELSDSAALAAVRDEIGKVGDKAHGWLLQAVAAILEGAPPAAGLDAL